MTSESDQYRKLCRLREKRKRLDRHISSLEKKLAGRKYTWGGCSYNRNRK